MSDLTVAQMRRRIEARINEDPFRFLDRDLVDDSDAKQMVLGRIRGMDRLEVVHLWLAAERFLASRTNREPRKALVDHLENRLEWLQEHGERPDDLDRPDEVFPERYRLSVRERPAKDFFWVGEDGERRPWSERPTTTYSSMTDDSVLFSGSENDETALADGGERE